jgi:glycosyltransferase involved in cell wall biosynthesis
MNKGIAVATGDIVGILNSDDVFYDDEVLQKVADFHTKNNIDASVGNIVQRKENGKLVRTYSSKKWTPEKLVIGFMPPHPSIFFKRSLFENYGNYFTDFKIGADYELITRFFLKYNISWGYSNITTHKMLIGGISSSGIGSYRLITNEIQKALLINNISFKKWKIKIRFCWKILDLLKFNRI